MTTFGDGVYQYGGMPVGNGRFTNMWGTHWFVDGTDGSDAYDGKSPVRSKATIQAAVTAASRGDVIYIRPLTYTTDGSDINRYVEAVTVPYATNDLSMIGVCNSHYGNPNYGAKLQYTVASSTCLTVNAPALHMENMCVRAEGATNAIHFNGTSGYATLAGSCGPTMYNVVIRGSLNGVRVTAGYAANIVGCRFEGGSATDNAIVLNGSASPQRRVRIQDCHIDSFNGAANDNAYIRILGPSTDLLIYRCTFDIIPTDTYYIQATGSNLGMIANCWFCDDSVDTDAEIVLGGLKVVTCWDVGGIATTA